ncbi:MAG: hypothetical protein Q8Q94_04360 [bacterium]|nr:hypothetical protein [bacterium]MDZ4299787.1 hypothetical protein [Candidatus Sungbacteria bacterium]
MNERGHEQNRIIPFNPPRHLTGYALTEYLENNPEFVALLSLVKGGDEELPAYLYMRTAVRRPQTKN